MYLIPYLLLRFIDFLFYLAYLAILIVVIHSWIPFSIPRPFRKAWFFIEEKVESFFDLFRRFIPVLSAGGLDLDLSPLVAILFLELLHNVIVRLIVIIFY